MLRLMPLLRGTAATKSSTLWKTTRLAVSSTPERGSCHVRPPFTPAGRRVAKLRAAAQTLPLAGQVCAAAATLGGGTVTQIGPLPGRHRRVRALSANDLLLSGRGALPPSQGDRPPRALRRARRRLACGGRAVRAHESLLAQSCRNYIVHFDDDEDVGALPAAAGAALVRCHRPVRSASHRPSRLARYAR